jgi:CheY-like chemotaxis protein
MSGLPRDELTALQAAHTHVVAVLRKPFDLAALQAALEKAAAADS